MNEWVHSDEDGNIFEPLTSDYHAHLHRLMNGGRAWCLVVVVVVDGGKESGWRPSRRPDVDIVGGWLEWLVNLD